jgi:histidinol-phosphatase (PHP family)
MKNLKRVNYHSHTNFCDGSNVPEDYVLRAIGYELFAYGFSSHAPVPFECKWCMGNEDLDAYISTIKALKSKYREYIEIYCGLEVDYIPGITGPRSEFIKALNLDYTIGSIHFVDLMDNGSPWEIDNTKEIFEEGLLKMFDNNIEKAIGRYFALTREMIAEETPNVVGHLDKIKMHNKDQRFFKETDVWYKREIDKTLEMTKAKGTIVEINTRGLYKGKSTDFYPSSWILEEICKMDIPVTISSDAHKPAEIILGFDQVYALLSQIGFRHKMILYQGEWIKVLL